MSALEVEAEAKEAIYAHNPGHRRRTALCLESSALAVRRLLPEPGLAPVTRQQSLGILLCASLQHCPYAEGAPARSDRSKGGDKRADMC